MGNGYHVIQAKIAIGSGGLTGNGYLNGTQTKGGFIPEAWTDFIFSVVGDDWGLIGTVGLLTLYGVMYEEELYQMFMSLTQMECSKEDFLRFIYLKGTFRQELRSGQNRFTKQKVVGFDEGIMERYLSYLEQNPIPVERSCKYENFKQLEQELNVAIERWQDIQYVMEQWKLPPEKLDAYMTEWYMLVSGGENSSRIFNEMMCEFDIEETVDIACLWRALMLICLQQPCYLLKGYSRLHAEKKCGIKGILR